MIDYACKRYPMPSRAFGDGLAGVLIFCAIFATGVFGYTLGLAHDSRGQVRAGVVKSSAETFYCQPLHGLDVGQKE